MGGWLIKFWSEWGIHILVLLSLALQVALLLFAGIRRREASWSVSRLLLWMAYQGADSCAIYVLGQLSLKAATGGHQIVAFWAPFLLLHLGGPDNITAYTLEDSRLWLRHLPTMFLQVVGAAYVIYKHILGTDGSLLVAAILMFIVGFFKYGERVWALKSNNIDTIRSSVKKKEPARAKCHFYLDDKDNAPRWGFNGAGEEEFLMRHAHSLFHICKHAMVNSATIMEPDYPELHVLNDLTVEHKYALMEMELSLMYDILYTKTTVIHTLFGYCLCICSLVATATAFLLFQFTGSNGRRNSVDVAVTYILLGGALFLETRLLLSTLGSSWTLPFLCSTRWSWLKHTVLCGGRWHQVRRWVVSLNQLIEVMGLSTYLRSARRWPGTVGQYNMLQLCTHPSKRKRSGADDGGSMSPPWDSPLLGRLAKMLGQEDWWDKLYFSGTASISEDLKERLLVYTDELVKRDGVSTQGVVREGWGERPLKASGLYQLKIRLGVEFQEGVIIWHIATDIFFAVRAEGEHKGEEHEAALVMEGIRVLSNYMMFLLVNYPYMLPGLDQSKLYQTTCQNLEDMWCGGEEDADDDDDDDARSLLNLFRLQDDPASRSSKRLASQVYKQKPDPSVETPRLYYAYAVARELIRNDDNVDQKDSSLQVLFSVWMDFLVYAANRCSRESHAKKLSSGGEFTTILWLLIEHFRQLLPSKRQEEE